MILATWRAASLFYLGGVLMGLACDGRLGWLPWGALLGAGLLVTSIGARDLWKLNRRPPMIQHRLEDLHTVHRCPPEGSGLMPCCGRTPFEVAITDRMTEDPRLVTCRDRMQ